MAAGVASVGDISTLQDVTSVTIQNNGDVKVMDISIHNYGDHTAVGSIW